MRSQKLAFVFLVLNATAVFCVPTADPSSVHELDINARAKGSGKKTNPSTTSNTKCRRGKSSGTSKSKRDLHARTKSSQTSSTGLILCGVKAQIAKPGVCKHEPFDGSEETTDSSAQNGQDGSRNGQIKAQGKTKRAKGSTTSTSSPDSAQSDTGEADTYSPLSRTNTQTSRLKAQLAASKTDANGQGQICDYTVDITVLDRTAFENLACPSFDALAGIIEKSKTEQLKLKEEWLKPTIMLMNKPSLNMWHIQKELFLSITSSFRRHFISNLIIFQKIDKTIEALSGLGTTATSGSSSQAEDNGSENENTESVSVQQYLTDAKVKAEIDAFATRFAGSITSAFAKAVKEAQACVTSAEKKKITKIQAQLNQKGGLRKLIPAGIQHYTDTIAGEEEPQEDTQDPQEEDPQDPQDPNQDVASDETASPTGPSSNPTESDSGSNGIDGPGSHGASGAPGSGSEESGGGGVEETGMGEGSGEENNGEEQTVGNNGGCRLLVRAVPVVLARRTRRSLKRSETTAVCRRQLRDNLAHIVGAMQINILLSRTVPHLIYELPSTSSNAHELMGFLSFARKALAITSVRCIQTPLLPHWYPSAPGQTLLKHFRDYQDLAFCQWLPGGARQNGVT